MKHSAWNAFVASRPKPRARRDVLDENRKLREIADRAADVLDFLDEQGLGDWPAPMRLRHAFWRNWEPVSAPHKGDEGR